MRIADVGGRGRLVDKDRDLKDVNVKESKTKCTEVKLELSIKGRGGRKKKRLKVSTRGWRAEMP